MRIRTIDVAGAGAAAIVLAYVFAYGYRYNVINRVGQRVKASNRAGDEDVWHFFHNARFHNAGSSDWIIVRDHKVDLQYFGAVSHWSESGEERELILTDVTVFRNTDGVKLYDCETMYLCRDRDGITIEINPTEGGENGA
ncbi:MAG: hypothetical protein M3541_00330 [Acidobacteriota bacterium]|nr:hypothetical protein [Acidobacteriota bacterium]